MIPWDEIEQRYAKFFANRKGNGAKPLRLALGASFAPNSTGAFDLPLTIGLSHGWLTLTILSDTLWVWLSYMYFCWSYNFFTVSSFALSCLGKLSVFTCKFSIVFKFLLIYESCWHIALRTFFAVLFFERAMWRYCFLAFLRYVRGFLSFSAFSLALIIPQIAQKANTLANFLFIQ